MQCAPVQQSESAPQISPSAPHVPTGWQRETPSGPGAQRPEQHELPSAQSSHSALHPPAAAQRWTASLPVSQLREQQSIPVPHVSPICRVQGMRSLVLHMAVAAQ
jgi:hypothetical protein